MATFTAIPDTDLDANSPITENLMLALRDNVLAIQEGDATAPKIQTDAYADGSITSDKLASTSVFPSLTAGNYVAAIDPETRSTTSTSYVKLSEIKIGAKENGSIRVSFSLKTNGVSGTAYGRVYKNGIAIGTVRSSTTIAYTEFSQDFSGIIAGDLIQIYGYISNASYTTSVINCAVKTGNAPTTAYST